MTRFIMLAATIALMTACGSGRHMQYDHGRAYTAAMTAQADLTRPAAASAAYPLSGTEAARIRLNVTTSTSDEETAESTLQQ